MSRVLNDSKLQIVPTKIRRRHDKLGLADCSVTVSSCVCLYVDERRRGDIEVGQLPPPAYMPVI